MTMWIESVGTTSVVWQYRLEDDLGQAVWTSRQVTVGVDMRTMKPCTVPDDLREGLSVCGPPEEA
jgi:acyl-CoA thioesterase FadM